MEKKGLNNNQSNPENRKGGLSAFIFNVSNMLKNSLSSDIKEVTKVPQPQMMTTFSEDEISRLKEKGRQMEEKTTLAPRPEGGRKSEHKTSLPDFVNSTPQEKMTAADAKRIEAVHQSGGAFGPSLAVKNLRPGKEAEVQRKVSV